MNKFLLKLSGYSTILEKTETALESAKADNEKLRKEIVSLTQEVKTTNTAYEHQLELYAKSQKEITLQKENIEALEKKCKRFTDALEEGIEAATKAKDAILQLESENDKLRIIAEKAEKYREAHNRKRREKRALAKEKKLQQQTNGEEGTK